ncbi:hypothetical protein [Micromonospora sp. WMMD975]|uniref:hypothetical protein n=1 Tax=Micromonospora sp. WMMD975 TaxID=3016087 RepID=UPI00249B37EC|nr:hypothetical protein [Micromonospora sp. WMMD975]WFE35675.1 hypothetical protein O7613_09950 [Micromonospora sp. WMMD975]
MAQVPEPSDHGRTGAAWGTTPMSQEIYGWLGTRFAVLEAPRHRAHMVGQRSERTHIDTHGVARDLGCARPVEVRVGHELHDDTSVDVTTVRDATGGSVVHHLWATLINYQLALAGRRGAPPWGGGPPPPQFIDRLDTNNPPEPTGTHALTIDGKRGPAWLYLACPDMSSETPLAACGGHIDDSLVIVTGPRDTVLAAQLRMLPE